MQSGQDDRPAEGMVPFHSLQTDTTASVLPSPPRETIRPEIHQPRQDHVRPLSPEMGDPTQTVRARPQRRRYPVKVADGRRADHQLASGPDRRRRPAHDPEGAERQQSLEPSHASPGKQDAAFAHRHFGHRCHSRPSRSGPANSVMRLSATNHREHMALSIHTSRRSSRGFFILSGKGALPAECRGRRAARHNRLANYAGWPGLARRWLMGVISSLPASGPRPGTSPARLATS